jgi:hypothetical protein
VTFGPPVRSLMTETGYLPTTGAPAANSGSCGPGTFEAKKLMGGRPAGAAPTNVLVVTEDGYHKRARRGRSSAMWRQVMSLEILTDHLVQLSRSAQCESHYLPPHECAVCGQPQSVLS